MKGSSIDSLIEALKSNFNLRDMLVDQDSASDEQLDEIDELLDRNVTYLEKKASQVRSSVELVDNHQKKGIEEAAKPLQDETEEKKKAEAKRLEEEKEAKQKIKSTTDYLKLAQEASEEQEKRKRADEAKRLQEEEEERKKSATEARRLQEEMEAEQKRKEEERLREEERRKEEERRLEEKKQIEEERRKQDEHIKEQERFHEEERKREEERIRHLENLQEQERQHKELEVREAATKKKQEEEDRAREEERRAEDQKRKASQLLADTKRLQEDEQRKRDEEERRREQERIALEAEKKLEQGGKLSDDDDDDGDGDDGQLVVVADKPTTNTTAITRNTISATVEATPKKKVEETPSAQHAPSLQVKATLEPPPSVTSSTKDEALVQQSGHSQQLKDDERIVYEEKIIERDGKKIKVKVKKIIKVKKAENYEKKEIKPEWAKEGLLKATPSGHSLKPSSTATTEENSSFTVAEGESHHPPSWTNAFRNRGDVVIGKKEEPLVGSPKPIWAEKKLNVVEKKPKWILDHQTDAQVLEEVNNLKSLTGNRMRRPSALKKGSEDSLDKPATTLLSPRNANPLSPRSNPATVTTTSPNSSSSSSNSSANKQPSLPSSNNKSKRESKREDRKKQEESEYIRISLFDDDDNTNTAVEVEQYYVKPRDRPTPLECQLLWRKVVDDLGNHSKEESSSSSPVLGGRKRKPTWMIKKEQQEAEKAAAAAAVAEAEKKQKLLEEEQNNLKKKQQAAEAEEKKKQEELQKTKEAAAAAAAHKQQQQDAAELKKQEEIRKQREQKKLEEAKKQNAASLSTQGSQNTDTRTPKSEQPATTTTATSTRKKKVKYPKMEEFDESGGHATREETLEWVNEITEEYDIICDNFTSSFANGMAFGAILNHFDPDSFDFDALDEEEAKENISKVLEFIEELGIEHSYKTSDVGKNAKATFHFLNTLLGEFEGLE